MSQKLVGVEGKEDCFGPRAKAWWHHMRDMGREAAFRPRGWSSYRWEVLWWMAREERLNPDQGEPAGEVDLYSAGNGRAPKIWGQR